MKGPTAVVLEHLATGKDPKNLGGLLTWSVAMQGQSAGLGARSLETFRSNPGTTLCLEQKF